MRAHRRAGRRLAQELGELTRAVTDPASARDLARDAQRDLSRQPWHSTRDVVNAVAGKCSDDAQRSGLAAYLHLCRDYSFEALAEVFAVTPAAARRLVERGTGTVPVTAADGCRGWALVAPRPGRTDGELRAASGHLSLCRRCRYRLRAHAALEQRVAAVGTAAFGASVSAAIGRAVAGGHVGSAAAGAITGPIVALSTAAALTAGVGAVAVTTHGGGASRPSVTNVRNDHDREPARLAPSARTTVEPSARQTAPAGNAPVATTTPGRGAPQQLLPLPLPTSSVGKLPVVSPPRLPTVRISPPVVTTSPLPVPLPTLTLPPLP
jgi:hypothetical protein